MSRSTALSAPTDARPRRRARHAAAAVPLALVLVVTLAAGCGGGSGGDGDSGEQAAADPSTTTTTAPDAAANNDTTTTATPTTTAPATGAPAEPTDDCADVRDWGTEAQGTDTMFAEDVYLVRPGRHECFDRIVFDVNGVVAGPDAVGFHAAYVDGDVLADASGEPVPTAGDASLEVVVRAPALGYGSSGHQPGRTLAGMGDPVVTTDQVAGWTSLREARFAGSFEGQTTFAVGVADRRPFRAGSYESNGYTHVYVDIAHP